MKFSLNGKVIGMPVYNRNDYGEFAYLKIDEKVRDSHRNHLIFFKDKSLDELKAYENLHDGSFVTISGYVNVRSIQDESSQVWYKEISFNAIDIKPFVSKNKEHGKGDYKKPDYIKPSHNDYPTRKDFKANVEFKPQVQSKPKVNNETLDLEYEETGKEIPF